MGWSDSLAAGSAEQVSALLDRATDFDGKAPVSEQGRHAVAGRGAARHLLELDGDTVVVGVIVESAAAAWASSETTPQKAS
ncbi:hypothetical protein AB0K68_49535 [Streptomyces sp. NPDC050698]